MHEQLWFTEFLNHYLGAPVTALLHALGVQPTYPDAPISNAVAMEILVVALLLVFFLAGYFAKRWEFLRELREKRPALAHITKWVEIPRLEYVLPVLVSILLMLAFFFLQKDLGPALARAIATVKSGQPALVDVVTDPR